MNAQLKYSFKKESALFFRRYHFLGMMLAIFGMAVFSPLMLKAMIAMGTMAQDLLPTQTAQIAVPNGADPSMTDFMDMFASAAMSFAYTLGEFAATSLLIIMIVIRSAAGGEQKKRTMIVPQCSGLKTKNYLLPKFVIYPLSMFGVTFFGGLTAGGICNAMFANDRLNLGQIALGSLMVSVYMMFILTVYISLGLCSARPGVMVCAVYIGQTLLQSFLEGMGLSDYQPFTLISALGTIFTGGEELARRVPSILTAIGLSVVICVLMYFLALGVLNAKKIDNTEEIKPQF